MRKHYLVQYGRATYTIQDRGSGSEIVAALVAVADLERSVDVDCDGYHVSISNMGLAALKCAEWLDAALSSAGCTGDDTAAILGRLQRLLSADELTRFGGNLGSVMGNVRSRTCVGPLFGEVTQ